MSINRPITVSQYAKSGQFARFDTVVTAPSRLAALEQVTGRKVQWADVQKTTAKNYVAIRGNEVDYVAQG